GGRTIVPVSPTEDRPPKGNRPAFEWKFDPGSEEVTYSVVLRQIEKGRNPEEGKILFEEKDIRGSSLPFPPEAAPLDSGQAYAWKVSAFNSVGQLAATSPWIAFSWHICWIWPYPAQYDLCGNQQITLKFASIIFGYSGPLQTFVQDEGKLDANNAEFLSRNDQMHRHAQRSPNPGIYTYNIKVKKGSCENTLAYTLNVPFAQRVFRCSSPICEGEAAVLSLSGFWPSNALIKWDYVDTPPGGSATPWYNGPVVNTNAIDPNNPNCSLGAQIIRTYTAIMPLDQWGFPHCAAAFDAELPEQLPGDGGRGLSDACRRPIDNINISSSLQPGQDMQRDNNGDRLPNYPVNVTYSLAGNIGTITGWSVNGSAITACGTSNTCSYSFTSSGTYTIEAAVVNGTCEPDYARLTIIIADPPPQPVISVLDPAGAACPFPICPHEDAILQVGISVPNTNYQWYYCPNQTNCPPFPGSAWILAGSGTVQNTNSIGPWNTTWTNVWWVVTAQDQNAICNAIASACCEIKVIQPPCAPVITIAGSIPKCPGQPVTLNATVPPCGPILNYQWYFWDGMPFGPQIPAGNSLSIQVTEPGGYTLVANGPCASAESDQALVKDHSLSVIIKNCPCCFDGINPFNLYAIGTTTCTTRAREHTYGPGRGNFHRPIDPGFYTNLDGYIHGHVYGSMRMHGHCQLYCHRMSLTTTGRTKRYQAIHRKEIHLMKQIAQKHCAPIILLFASVLCISTVVVRAQPKSLTQYTFSTPQLIANGGKCYWEFTLTFACIDDGTTKKVGKFVHGVRAVLSPGAPVGGAITGGTSTWNAPSSPSITGNTIEWASTETAGAAGTFILCNQLAGYPNIFQPGTKTFRICVTPQSAQQITLYTLILANDLSFETADQLPQVTAQPPSEPLAVPDNPTICKGSRRSSDWSRPWSSRENQMVHGDSHVGHDMSCRDERPAKPSVERNEYQSSPAGRERCRPTPLQQTTCYIALIENECFQYLSAPATVVVCDPPADFAIQAPAGLQLQSPGVYRVCGSWTGTFTISRPLLTSPTQCGEQITWKEAYVNGPPDPPLPPATVISPTNHTLTVPLTPTVCYRKYVITATNAQPNAQCGTQSRSITVYVDRPISQQDVKLKGAEWDSPPTQPSPLGVLCYGRSVRIKALVACNGIKVVEWQRSAAPWTAFAAVPSIWTTLSGTDQTMLYFTNNLENPGPGSKSVWYRVKIQNGACPAVWSAPFEIASSRSSPSLSQRIPRNYVRLPLLR
ncbi:MAG: PKD domain-containing protein, partial [Ignavibacteria bacterium]|nr:PKD domain-containing protein [Ignavibacteria bacterium]